MSDRTASKIIGAMLALVFLLALGAVHSSWTEDQAVGVETEQQAAEGVHAKKIKNDIGRATSEQAPTVNRNGAAKKDETDDDTSEFWPPLFGFRLKITDTLLVLFTGMLAWSTRGLQKSTVGLQRAADEQARITNNLFLIDQSPWLNVHARLTEDPDYNQIDCTITLRIRISCKNIGKSPAVDAADGISQAHIGYEGFQEDFDSTSAFVAVQSESKGMTIFLNDEVNFNTEIVLDRTAIQASKNITEGMPMHFFTVGYAYKSSLSDALFETVRMYQFGIPIWQTALPLPNDENWGMGIEFRLWKESVT